MDSEWMGSEYKNGLPGEEKRTENLSAKVDHSRE